jgi:signal transduction histidine kinase
MGIQDQAIVQRMAREIERFAKPDRTLAVSILAHLCELSARFDPQVILLDDTLLQGGSAIEILRQLTAVAPVILIASGECPPEVARIVAEGNLDIVARADDFIPLAGSLIERRLSRSVRAQPASNVQSSPFLGDIGEIFRHEINNPLTGILGNAELVLAHRDRLPAADTQRLQTVVELAVRLRETVRRVSDTWQARPHSLKPPNQRATSFKSA